MDAVLLSRIQFGLAAGFHFLFPPTTFGLALFILILETIYLRLKDELYRKLSDFLVRILATVFVMGTATGIVLEFSFGTNWSEYSRMVGDIFGAPLAAEGVFAFFLESVFLGILVFGRNRVSQKAYWVSAFLVFFGAHLSGLWIIIANSWMQTPAGFKLEAGRAILIDFYEAAVNHSTIIRYFHTIVAGWITGSLLVAGISSFYLLKKRDIEPARKLLTIAMIVFIFTGIIQLPLGHLHSIQVAETQPEKLAAYESLWETKQGAPLALFGIPVESEKKTYLYLGIPKLLSFLIHFDPEAEVKGLNEFPEKETPPVFLPFVSYHVMILLGFYFIALSILGAYLLFRKKLWDAKLYQKLLLFSIPFPYLANEFGWIGAEVGRQPWAVYRVLRTDEAVSAILPAGNVAFSLLMFTLIYAFLAVIAIYAILVQIKQGPGEELKTGY